MSYSPAAASPRIFNGTPASISDVPWQAVVYSGTGDTLQLCGGSIISPTQVLTAAHCVESVVAAGNVGADPNGEGGLGVIAGTSDFKTAQALSYFYGSRTAPPGDAEQDRTVTSAAIHPGYSGSLVGSSRGPTGDLAVIGFDSPLDVSGPTAQVIALRPVESIGSDAEPIPLPTSALISGFGQQASGVSPNGRLYLEHETVLDRDICGPGVDAAVNICAGSTDATTCHGDSGSGLVEESPTPVLIGLVSAGPSAGCAVGEPTYYTSLVVPENRLWLAGDETPPKAPRQRTPITLSVDGQPVTGNLVVCSGGSFVDASQIRWKFTDETGRVLFQEDATRSSYQLSNGDVGHVISCRAQAASEGGVAISERRTLGSPVRASGDATTVSPIATSQSVTAVPSQAPALRPMPRTTATLRAVTATVRRGHPLRFVLSVTGLPADATRLRISAPRIGRSSRSHPGIYASQLPVMTGSAQQAISFSLLVPKGAALGRRNLPVRIVYRDDDPSAVATATATFRIRR